MASEEKHAEQTQADEAGGGQVGCTAEYCLKS